MKKLFRSIIILTCFLSLGISLPTFATDTICDNDNIPEEVKEANGCPGSNSKDATDIVQTIIYSIIAVLGIVAVIFIIIGGVSYMTSSGDPGKVKKAKDTILYACIGLIICALAFAITNWVINILNNA